MQLKEDKNMCQATVYMLREGKEEEIMKDVISLEPTEEGILLKGLFDEPKLIQGKIEKIDFLKHLVTLTRE